MKTGVARLVGRGSERVSGLVLPNDSSGRVDDTPAASDAPAGRPQP
jgi:hypothetical protein